MFLFGGGGGEYFSFSAILLTLATLKPITV